MTAWKSRSRSEMTIRCVNCRITTNLLTDNPLEWYDQYLDHKVARFWGAVVYIGTIRFQSQINNGAANRNSHDLVEALWVPV